MLLDGLSGLNCKTRRERIQIGIGVHLSGIKVQFFAPHQLSLLTLFNDRVKEAPEHLHSIALTYAGEAGMVGKRLTQIIAKVPEKAEPICRMPHQLPFRAYPLKKQDKLELEEHDWINGRTASTSIGLVHEFTDEREVERLFQMPVEVIWWY